MSSLQEIEEAIVALPPAEFKKLAGWIGDLHREQMSHQETLAVGSELDALWAKAEREINAGETVDLDEFFDHQKFS
ncbi:MAG: hypothetical protein ACFCU3_06525 [Verrucomicrobiales bacterium]